VSEGYALFYYGDEIIKAKVYFCYIDMELFAIILN
jgi:hypothetical protein